MNMQCQGWKGTTRLAAIVMLASLAGCISIKPDNSIGIAKTEAELNQKTGMYTRVYVPAGSTLRGASVDGKPAYCTLKPGWFSYYRSHVICFTDTAQSGTFDRYYILSVTSPSNLVPQEKGLDLNSTATSVPYKTISLAELVAARQAEREAAYRADPVAAQAAEAAATNAVAAEQRARSECVYQAQAASSMSYGLVHSLFAGIGVGSACIEHYQRIGVIP